MLRSSLKPLQGAGMLAIKERGVQVDQNTFQAVFEVPGMVSIDSTGTIKKVRVASEDLTPEIKIRAVPRLDPTAYLYAKFIYEGSVPILSGKVDLYRGRRVCRYPSPPQDRRG